MGFKGERCIPGVEGHRSVRRFNVVQPCQGWPRALFLAYAPLKVILQVRSGWGEAGTSCLSAPGPAARVVSCPYE